MCRCQRERHKHIKPHSCPGVWGRACWKVRLGEAGPPAHVSSALAHSRASVPTRAAPLPRVGRAPASSASVASAEIEQSSVSWQRQQRTHRFCVNTLRLRKNKNSLSNLSLVFWLLWISERFLFSFLSRMFLLKGILNQRSLQSSFALRGREAKPDTGCRRLPPAEEGQSWGRDQGGEKPVAGPLPCVWMPSLPS